MTIFVATMDVFIFWELSKSVPLFDIEIALILICLWQISVAVKLLLILLFCAVLKIFRILII